MAQEIGLAAVCDEIGQAFNRNDPDRVEQLLWPALDQFPDMPQLWFYAGNVAFQRGRVALSEMCFERCIALDSNPMVYANLGAAKRRLNRHEEGAAVLRIGLERLPDYEPTLINLGSMFVNEGSPEEGIPPLERACELGKQKGRYEKGARWNLGLLYLEACRFAEGFELYRTGLGSERQSRTYGYDQVKWGDEVLSAPEPEWLQPEHSGQGKTLIVYGEQGIGDELMASTLLKTARQEFAEVIFECHPRLVNLHKAAHPGMRIFGTRKETHIRWPLDEKIRADYKAPIFDLAARYRPDLQSFLQGWAADGPLLKADPTEAQQYRTWLRAFAGGRPIVALGTRGGVPSTARQYRTIRPEQLEPLFTQTNALFVSVDYDDMSQFTLYCDQKFGPGRFLWRPSIVQHWDYDHTAALLAACDLTVTVCQSAFHLSAGLGLPTVGLVPKRCAWRYAPVKDNPELSYWYPSPNVRLYRQQGDSWQDPITRATARIQMVRA